MWKHRAWNLDGKDGEFLRYLRWAFLQGQNLEVDVLGHDFGIPLSCLHVEKVLVLSKEAYILRIFGEHMLVFLIALQASWGLSNRWYLPTNSHQVSPQRVILFELNIVSNSYLPTMPQASSRGSSLELGLKVQFRDQF